MKRTTLIAHMKRLGINPRTAISPASDSVMTASDTVMHQANLFATQLVTSAKLTLPSFGKQCNLWPTRAFDPTRANSSRTPDRGSVRD